MIGWLAELRPDLLGEGMDGCMEGPRIRFVGREGKAREGVHPWFIT